MGPPIIKDIFLHPKGNARDSHTEEFDLVNKPKDETAATPVLRRGANFYLTVRFENRVFDEKLDDLEIIFKFGPTPTVYRGTLVPLRLDAEKGFPENPKFWGLRLERKIDEVKDVMFQIHISPDAPVGIWTCTVNGKPFDKDIYILFNPWSPFDSVYMEKEEELKEYILNESGKIWCGSYKRPIGRRWIYGQFDEIVLPAAVFLLEKSKLPHHERGSPIQVTRTISAMINSHDDDGVVVGRWDGDYKGGVAPFDWTGSALIMDKYLRNGGKPVKYGQCWVFSAVVVTVCRALGIPCRSVTNFVSAHDTDSNMTIDKYFDKSGRWIKGGPRGDNNDSVWNFHVWNDVWMARPDLPVEYGGWQIIDATPQELSGGAYRLGPAPLLAVRKGELFQPYDTRFVTAEVKADICHFQEDDESEYGFIRTQVNRYGVGKKIVTKRIDEDDDEGDSDLWDITNTYKSLEAKQAVHYSLRMGDFAEKIDDVEFDLVDIDEITLGQSFDVVVNTINKSRERRTIKAFLTAETVFYTGIRKEFIKTTPGQFTLKPGQREQLKIHIDPFEYIDKLSEDNLIKIYAMARVKETKQTWGEEDDFLLTKPKVNITFMEERAQVGIEYPVEFSFQNPLDVALTNCTYTVQGPGIHKMKTVKHSNVGPLQTAYFVEKFTVKRPGNKKIVVIFNSKEIKGIRASAKYVATS